MYVAKAKAKGTRVSVSAGSSQHLNIIMHHSEFTSRARVYEATSAVGEFAHLFQTRCSAFPLGSWSFNPYKLS